jgi:hypothetical protein
MTRRLMMTMGLATLLAFAAPLAAHDDYRFIGTVVRIPAGKLDVKQTKDGKIISMKTDSRQEEGSQQRITGRRQRRGRRPRRQPARPARVGGETGAGTDDQVTSVAVRTASRLTMLSHRAPANR